MKHGHIGLALTAFLTLAAGACEDPIEVDPPFDLRFISDATFQGPHGDQTLRVAILSDATGEVIAQDQGTVAIAGANSFNFYFAELLQPDTEYQLHYWIDSNFGSGRADVCDAPADDHQWWFRFGPTDRHLQINETHRPDEVADACATFAADLTFQGDASFQAAHGGQTVHAAVVRTADGAVLWTQQSTVSGTEDPSFAFEFPGALLYDDAFEIHYWIDSNFGGGTQGTCDPATNDHQWAIDLGQPDAPAILYEDTHRPTETGDVCATFQ